MTFQGIHQFYLLLRAVLLGKDIMVNIVFLIHGRPLCLKRERVDEIHDGIGRNRVQNFRNHPVGFFLDPLVDILERGGIEGGAVDISTVVVGIHL